MLSNLEAEQARKNMTDTDVAKILGITRETYVKKKKNLGFKFNEIISLCSIFDCDFHYLFEINKPA